VRSWKAGLSGRSATTAGCSQTIMPSGVARQVELIDVTPQKDQESRIVFCPGSSRWDGGHLIASVYEPLVRDRTVRRLCEVGNDIQRWLERNTTCGEPYEPDFRFVQLNVAMAS